GDLVAVAAKRFPGDPAIAILAAMDEARHKKWDAALRRLRVVDVTALAPELREHLHHVRGMAAWHTGDIATARVEWSRGAGGTHCRCDGLAERAAAHLGAVATRTLVGRVARAVAAADERLGTGDPRGAIAAVDAPEIWIVRENQAAARRAKGWLRIEVEPGSV